MSNLESLLKNLSSPEVEKAAEAGNDGFCEIVQKFIKITNETGVVSLEIQKEFYRPSQPASRKLAILQEKRLLYCLEREVFYPEHKFYDVLDENIVQLKAIIEKLARVFNDRERQQSYLDSKTSLKFVFHVQPVNEADIDGKLLSRPGFNLLAEKLKNPERGNANRRLCGKRISYIVQGKRK